MNRLFFHRLAMALGFILTPFILGMVLMVTLASDILIIKEPEALDSSLLKQSQSLDAKDQKKISVAILTAQKGTQATELLLSYGVFASDPRFFVYTVGLSRQPSALTGSASMIPDFDLQQAPSPDILVIPSIANWNDPALILWLKENVKKTQWTVALSEGIRALLASATLDAEAVSSHPAVLEDIRSYNSSLKILNERATRSGQWISSRSPASVIDALAKLPYFNESQLEPWTLAFWQVGHESQTIPPKAVGMDDLLFMFLSGGFQWHRPGLGILLYPGVHEKHLAAALDTVNHSWNGRSVSFYSERKAIQSQHGLTLVPTLGAESVPLLDALVIPGGRLANTPLVTRSLDLKGKTYTHPRQLPGVEDIIARSSAQLTTLDLFEDQNSSTSPYVSMYHLIENLSSFANALYAAQWIDYPRNQLAAQNPLYLQLPKVIWLRLFGIALMGMTICGFISRRLAPKGL